MKKLENKTRDELEATVARVYSELTDIKDWFIGNEPSDRARHYGDKLDDAIELIFFLFDKYISTNCITAPHKEK